MSFEKFMDRPVFGRIEKAISWLPAILYFPLVAGVIFAAAVLYYPMRLLTPVRFL